MVPTINEVEGMRQIMPLVKREWVDQVVVVDGGSTDGTVEYARSRGYDVAVQKRPGLVGAYRDAFPLVRGDYLVTFSPDGNSVPEVLPELTAKLREGFDMVIASRYLGGKESADDDALSRLGNWLFTKTINLLFSARYTDSLVMYRGYRTSLLRELGLLENRRGSLEEYCERLCSWELLSTIRAAKERLHVAEIYGPEPARVAGETRVPKFQAASFALGLIVEEFLFRHVPPNIEKSR
ncbi:glycosyltransferase family 2 protein [bacterium]|nr:glycosyltransferase family 2 protein [bacterium]